jgi:ERCC4-type nuclease
MVYLDPRKGSGELYQPLRHLGLQVTVEQLDFADVMFHGNGADGDCVVGIERKTIRDLINSMETKRLAGHQLAGLVENFHYAFLFVEGIWRPGTSGDIEEMRGGGWRAVYLGGRTANYRAVHNHLTTLDLLCGVRTWRTYSTQETCRAVSDLYHWFNDKAWEGHESHIAVHSKISGPVRLVKPDLVWRMAAQLDGVDRRAQDVSRRFKTVVEMVNATEKQWREVKGTGKKKKRGIGEVLAKRIRRQLGHEDD